ncbi:hypothetical protein FPRO03_03447 [Fusarium proliferatum]|nr:hypothetical protein FPRO03_03447 [Fusarium proliferatum]
MSRTPNTPSRAFQIRTNGLFKKGNTLFNLLHPKVTILIQPGDDVIPGSGEPLAYASHRREEWPELYDFFESAGVKPRKVFGPDDFDTVAARQSSAPKDRAPVTKHQVSDPRQDTPFPEIPHHPGFFQSVPESQSSDSCRETPFSEMPAVSQQVSLVTSGLESQAPESLRATPVPDMTSMHSHASYDRLETEQDFDQSLLSILSEPLEQKFEAQTQPKVTHRAEQRTKSSGRPDDGLRWSREATPHVTNKRKAATEAEGMRKRRSTAGPEDRDRRRKMMTRSQGRSYYS